MKKRPSFFLFSAALMGAFFGLKEVPLLLFLSLAGLALFLLLVFRQHRLRILAFLGLIVFVCAASAQRAKNIYDHVQASIPKNSLINGTILDVWPRSGNEIEALIASQSMIIKLKAIDEASRIALKAGHRIALRAQVKPLEPALSPSLFDAYRYGLSHHIHGHATINDPAFILLSPSESSWISSLRSHLRGQIRLYLNPHQSSLLLALILGETSMFSVSQKEIYQSIGAQHLLAVSGLQISMLAWLCLMLFIPFFTLILPARISHRSFLLSVLLTIGLVGLFVLLCHSPRSAIRAALMSTIVLVPATFGRKIDLFDALFMSGFFTLLLDPLSIGDIGFLLSYAATFGLLSTHAFGQPIHKIIAAHSRLGALLFLWFISSLGAFLATFSITSFFFGSWVPASMLANWFLVPIAAALQIPAIIFGLLGAFLNAPGLLTFAAWCASLIELFAHILSETFGAIWQISQIVPLALLVLTVGSFCLFLSVLARRKSAMLMSSLLILAPLTTLIPFTPRPLKITVIPVGQGDASLVQMPSGHTMLIDAGGSMFGDYDPGHSIVVPTLKRLGVRSLDILAISHPDPDHILGAFAVLEEMSVKEIWHSGFKADHPLTKRLLLVATQKKIPVKDATVLLGTHRFGESEVAVLAPHTHSERPYFENLKANDNSLVLRIEHKGRALLWPGDLEKKGEELLLREAVNLSADIVKAPHHGSRTSSSPALIERVKPQFVIFSTGRDNRFSFPHEDVVDRYQKLGIRGFNTATDGEITINITDDGIDIAGFISPCRKDRSGSCLIKGQPNERST